MAGGFIMADRDNTDFKVVERQYIAKPSTQFYAGDALIFVNGRLEQAATATAQVDAIFNALFTDPSLFRPATPNLTTATLGDEALYFPCRGNGSIWKTYLTGTDAPPINLVAANANTNTSEVLVTAAGATNNYVGGTVFANGQQRTIVTDVVNSSVHTFTVNKPFTQAITTGMLVTAVPFSRGTRGVQLSSGTVYQGINTAVAGATGGKVDIEDVKLNNLTGSTPYVLVSFQY